MQKFCEMCITTYSNSTHQDKLANWSTTGMWVGYTDGHPNGTYQVFNPKTKKIILTRDVTFLQKSYGESIKVEKYVLVTVRDERLDDEEEFKMVPVLIIIITIILLVISTVMMT